MRKWLVFFCIFFLILSIISYIILYKKEDIVQEVNVDIYNNEDVNDEEVEIYEEIKSSKAIKMYRPEVNDYKEIDFNDYLRGVVASEMPADYSIEALKAQAIVARTFFFKKQEEGHVYDCNICSSANHCQEYKSKEDIFDLWKTLKGWSDEEIIKNWNRVNSAVISTGSKVILYDNKLINAFFHASSPIKTENSYEIWGKEYIPYLVSVENVESDDYKNRYSDLEVENGYFEDKVKETLNPDFSIGDGKITINTYTDSGRVRDVIVNNYVITAENLRKIFGLKSTLFSIENIEGGNIFHVVGYGHGIGMSQVGADFMGKNGKTYEEIIKYYYKRSRNTRYLKK